MIAACGLVCSQCPAYIATLNNDDQLRQQTAASWSKMFNIAVKPEDINCLGCFSKEEPIFAHCQECKIRACCLKKVLTNCSCCLDYPCPMLSEFHVQAPAAKEKLDTLRSKK